MKALGSRWSRTRLGRPDIFVTMRYLDLTLAACIGEAGTIR